MMRYRLLFLFLFPGISGIIQGQTRSLPEHVVITSSGEVILKNVTIASGKAM